MQRKEKIRLMVKYKVRSCSGGVYGDGFLAGLQACETRAERKPIKKSDVEPPTTPQKSD